MRILVCGGRDYNDWDTVHKALEMFRSSGKNTLICGMAKGADSLGLRWAELYGYEVEKYYPDWNKYGKSAGFRRNSDMLNLGKPDVVVAFPGGKGTAMMVDIARKAGVKVIEVN